MVKLPGPIRLPFIGSAWTFWPIIGYDNVTRMHEGYLKKFNKYGSVVKEDIFGKTIISVFDPRDIGAVFHNERKVNPQRVSHDILLAIRRERPNLYSTGGLVPTNGDEWKKLRMSYQQEVLRQEIIARYVPDLESVSREFVRFLTSNLDKDGVVPNLLYRTQEWALENIGVVTLDERVDSFSTNRNALSQRLVDGANAALNALAYAEYSPWWRFLPSSLWDTMVDVDYMFYDYIRSKVEKQRMSSLQSEKPPCVMKQYLDQPENDIKDIITVCSDLIFTGILTTAMAMSFFLYNIATNCIKQDKLYREICLAHPDKKQPLTWEQIKSMEFLKGCLMENYRMSPLTLGTSRILQYDLLLAGQIVPKGTYMLAQNQVSGLLPNYVLQPDGFIPERWYRKSLPGYEKFVRPHPFLVLPFGSGPRSCLGRRLADLELGILIILLLRKFRVEWIDEKPLGIKTMMISVPNRPLAIRFVPRLE